MTTTTIDQLDGKQVRAWVDGTLILIGSRCKVEPYADGLVKLRSDEPFGAGCVLPATTEATREPSGTWTVTA